MDALRHFGVSEERIGQLVALVTAVDSSEHALVRPGHLDDDLIAAYSRTVATINGQVGEVPFVRLQLTLAPIVGACRRLLRASNVSRPESFLILATDALALSARLAFETRDDDTAAELYRAATDSAGGLNDLRHRAAVRRVRR